MEKKAILNALWECHEQLIKAGVPLHVVRSLETISSDVRELPNPLEEELLIHFYSDDNATIECCIARCTPMECKELLRKATYLLSIPAYMNDKTKYIIKVLRARLTNSNFEITHLAGYELEPEEEENGNNTENK